MTWLALSKLSDDVISRELHALVALDRVTTVKLLAHLAEFDRRRLYAPAGYPSMFAYCVERLGFSEGGAYTRIEVARKALQFPELLRALADGRLHLAGARLLVPHMLPDNVERLLEAAAHRTKRDIEIQLALLFPKPEALRLDEGISAMRPTQLVPGRVAPSELAPGQVGTVELAPGQVRASELDPGRVEPMTAQRFSIQVTVSDRCHGKLRQAQSLLRHAVPRAEIEEVLERALDALLEKLARQKHAATRNPRPMRRQTDLSRRISAHIRRTVWERDGGQCTFVGSEGHRCGETDFIEFDHITPVAKGGKATAENLQLRCRTHNRLEAVRQFGEEFMKRKEGRSQGPRPPS